MKNAKKSLFALGILAVLLSGCFNPITAIPPKQGDPAIDPFMVDVLIGKDTGAARSVAGPDADRIKGGIRNIIQLIVVDETGKIVAFDEVRRAKESDTGAVLRIDSIPFNRTYHFLLLMGHWERNYAEESGGDYKYTANPPTLLAAGMKDQLVTGSGKVTIPMWPIVVDTVFTTADQEVPPAARTAAPAVTGGKPSAVSLLPVDWEVTWTVRRGIGGDGLTDLVRAYNTINDPDVTTLPLKGKTAVVRAGAVEAASDPAVNRNVITLGIGTYTPGIQNIGKTGSVNFKLEYVPFNLTGGETNPWTAFNAKSAFDLSGSNAPVWIIRNGVNDEAQDTATDFTNLGNGTANGNGAVSFTVAAGSPADPATELVIKNGVFKGPPALTTPDIAFTTAGYSGNAEVYYAVAAGGSPAAPAYSAYTLLGSLGTGDHREQITLSNPDIDNDVYVFLFKGGKASAPIKINTTSGALEPGWEWGGKAITAFSITSPVNAAGVIDEDAKTVTIAVPHGTPVTNMIPSITVSEGAGVSPASGTAQDFSSAKTYTVRAADDSTQAYTVTVNVAASSAGMGTTDTVNGVSFDLRYVPAGEFQRDKGIGNVSRITKGYWMGETEVTQELWQAVMGNNPSQFTASPADGETQNKRPVEKVNWYDAIAFCNKLSLLAGKTPVYILNGVDWNALTYAAIPPSNNAAWDEAAMNPAADGYRLPTEMEWMWAAMGADTAATGMRNTGGYTKPFAGSGTLDNNAWHYGNSGNKTHEVKKKDANELGLYDMSGNVYEWTYDWWTESYPAGTLVSPTGADSGVNRVVRGGNWNSTAPICMVAYRPSINPGKRDSSIIGFRVVRAE